MQKIVRNVTTAFLFAGIAGVSMAPRPAAAQSHTANVQAPSQTPTNKDLADKVNSLSEQVFLLTQQQRGLIEMLSRQQAPIFNQLQDLKKLIEANASTSTANRPTAPDVHGTGDSKAGPFCPDSTSSLPADLNVDRLYSEGSSGAKVAVIEFTDYECDNCGNYARTVYPQIFTNYIETGKIRYFHWDFPSPSHPHSLIAARAAHCAGEQGKFWQMHDDLFAHQDALTSEQIAERAKDLGLDDKLFRQCQFGERYADDIVSRLSEARKLGITGTPTFYIGTLDSTGNVVKVEKEIVGAKPFDEFQSSIDSLLGSPSSQTAPLTPSAAADSPATASATPPANDQGVAADVDGHAISMAELERSTMRRYGHEILGILIDNYLIDQEAKRLNIEVSQAEIDSQVQAIADGIKPKTLEEGLKDHHQTLAELQDDIRHRLLGLKLAAIGIPPAHYAHAHVILIKTGTSAPDGHTESDALALTKTIQDKFKVGAKFDDLVKQYSEDASTKNRGGDISGLFGNAPAQQRHDRETGFAHFL
jgi:protein-disulfide isomerase